ncbi:DUF5327 family protein [Macrococcus lamae]|uniref:YwdI family protein n=1 Tax=Macrococcus lamae TaxID=198484 RepID=A0A4R6BV41_9STAP|nr:DUF5327 family protein [Macrococcus lamae]TDM11989.1 hypothetical protein ERX29_05200 [Macrococcus lamae]
MNQQLIKQIEQELTLAKSAVSQAAFEKHMYAIQTLASLITSMPAASSEPAPSSINSGDISAAELKMMGGTIKDKAVTDDGHGNGESLFDF